jgi:hypothetical protein
MIIKSAARGNPSQAGNYLLAKGDNNRSELISISGTVSRNIPEAIEEMEAVAKGSRVKKFLYHVSMSPDQGEHLSKEQWAYAWGEYEKTHGLVGHQKIIVQHENNVGDHQHALYNRVKHDRDNPRQLVVFSMSNDYRKNELVSRQIEKDFGLRRVIGRHILDRYEKPSKRSPTKYEIAQAKRTGINLNKFRYEIRRIMSSSINFGAEVFDAALIRKGYILAKGRSKGLVVLDPSGAPHPLCRTLGLRFSELENNFEDISYLNFQNVKDSRITQKKESLEKHIDRKKQIRCTLDKYFIHKQNQRTRDDRDFERERER